MLSEKELMKRRQETYNTMVHNYVLHMLQTEERRKHEARTRLQRKIEKNDCCTIL